MSKYTGYNKELGKASMKYMKENIEVVRVQVRKGTKDVWKEYARQRGMSLQAYIASLVEADNPVPGDE